MKLYRLILPLLCLVLLAGCGSDPVTASVFAMDTVMDLTVYGDETALSQASDLITQLEHQVSVTDPGSELYAVNHGTGGLTGRGADLFTEALALCRRTEGSLDISIYPLVREWGFTTGDYHVPSEDTLEALRSLVDYQKISLSGDEIFLPAGMEIDLGSVTKGYLGRELASLLRSQGVTSALLNLGGNVQTVGAKPDGSPWKIGVKSPDGEGYLGILEIKDQAVVTSGGYERFFEQDGETYWHILDPETGKPARSGLISVTVVGQDGLICDGLSTALFVMGLEKSVEFWRNSTDFEAIFVTEDGNIYLTEGLDGVFTLSQSRQLEVISRD